MPDDQARLWAEIEALCPPHVGAVIVDPRDDLVTMRAKLDGVYIYDHMIGLGPGERWVSIGWLLEHGVLDGVTLHAPKRWTENDRP